MRMSYSASTRARRVAIGAVVLVLMTVVAVAVAFVTRDRPEAPKKDRTGTAPPGPIHAPPTRSPSSPHTAVVATPPVTGDPIVFGKAFAAALWSYDARRTSRRQHLAALQGWLTKEKKYTDWPSVVEQVPSPLLWSRLRDNGQFATAKVGEGHFPAAFTEALNDDPGALTQAYLYAVTVSGTQSIAWRGSGAGAEERVVTVAVQCRPGRRCSAAAVLPNAAP